mgnify:CR=1 FL=1|jgi:hypothetical protein
MSDRSLENLFKVELRFSDELETLTPELRDAQAKLADLVSSVKHPGALGDFLVRMEGVPVNRTSSSWWVWKGTTGKEKNIHGLRFFLQWNRLSNDLLVLTVRFRGRKDKSPAFITRVKNGDIQIHVPKFESNPDKRLLQKATLEWIQAPIGTGHLRTHQITESDGIPSSLSRLDILSARIKNGSTTVDLEGRLVSLSTDGDKTHISIEGSRIERYRSYDSKCLESEDRWRVIRETADQADIDPCLILSIEEQKFLENFTIAESLPARIDGSAGSGKTTLLSHALAELIAMRNVSREDLFDAPLFLTYSNGLRDVAIKRLKYYLMVHHDWSEVEAANISGKVCRTFTDMVDFILSDVDSHSNSNYAVNEWTHFINWWHNGSPESVYVRNGLSARSVYTALRTYIFGYLPPNNSASEEQLEDVWKRWERTKKHSDISDWTISRALNIWEQYRLTLPSGGTNSDRTIRARQEITNDPSRFATWGYILCDEVQDLTDNDLHLLTCLTRHSMNRYQIHASNSEKTSINVILPLMLAGDEMQSINPTGFTFVGCQETLTEIGANLGFEIISIPNPCRLTENFRSLKLIVEIGTACRQLHNSFGRNRLTPAITVHRDSEESGKIQMYERVGEPDDTLKNLFKSRGVAILLPCSAEEKSEYCKPHGELASIIGFEEFDQGALYTPEQCKGLEFNIVVICGFGKSYETALHNERLYWMLNALSVAVTRARDRIIFLDSNGQSEILWSDLAEHGKLEWTPEPIDKIEVSDEDIAETLLERMKNKLCDYDSNQDSVFNVAEIIRLKSEIDEKRSTTNYSSSYLQRLNLAARASGTCIEYVQDDAISDWEALTKYSGGRVWERIIDDAIATSNTNILNQALDAHVEIKSENLGRMFTAACICMLEMSKRVDSSSALLRMCERLAALDEPSGRINSFFRDLEKEWKNNSYWKSVKSSVSKSQEHWDVHTTGEILIYLETFEVTDPMMAVIDIRSNIMDFDKARLLVGEWKIRVPNHSFDSLEAEIFLHRTGITWLDGETITKDILPIFREKNFNEADLAKVLASEGPRNCAEKNLGVVIEIINPNSNLDRQNLKDAQVLAKYAISSIVLHESTRLVTMLENIALPTQTQNS